MPADDAADPSPRSARSHISGELRRDRSAVRSTSATPPDDRAAQPQRTQSQAPRNQAPQNDAPQNRAPQKRVSKKGQFHRPELTTPWQKFTGNLAVRIVFWSLLVVVTGAVVVLAVQRFAL